MCNGSNGTPDLRNRFIVGSGGEYPTKNTGGAKSVTLTENQMPSHRHTANSNSTGSHKHSISGGYHTHSYNDLYYVESGWDDKRSNTSYGTESMTTALGSGDSDYNNGTGYTKKKIQLTQHLLIRLLPQVIIHIPFLSIHEEDPKVTKTVHHIML